MADDKIVTKKTAAKPAAPTNPSPATAPAATKTVVKKTTAKAASPSTTAPPAPPMTPATPTKKAGARSTEPVKTAAKPKPTRPSPKAPLEDKPVSLQHLTNVTPEQRQHMIQEAAYYRAEKRHFTGGSDAEDWAEAEREIDELMAKAIQIFGA
ncbi:MAG TPA: DUF2934 domain-containing protein [Lamprocystis sp. (in: g-proteobacteria)]|nr:DUF2934 domain-containing protein [Lamprocystis sp. (in: g-proteobacteria)]